LILTAEQLMNITENFVPLTFIYKRQSPAYTKDKTLTPTTNINLNH